MSVTISGILPESTHLSGNPIEVILTTTGVPAGSSNYKMLLKVVSTDGELPGGPWIDEKSPDSNNQRKFNISGYVDQSIDKTISWPLVGFANPHPQMVYDIWLYPGEKYYDAAGVYHETFGDPLQPVFIVKGRLPEYKRAELVSAGSSWSSYFCVAKRMFTLMPRTQKVSPWQPVKLWWKTNAISSEETAVITGYFSDNTTQVKNENFTAYRGVLLECDIQPGHMGFVLNNGIKKLVKYTFTLGGETFTFNIDWSYHEKYYYLFVDNQVGGIDCIWLSGGVKFSPTGDKSLAVKPRQATDGVKVPGLYVSGNSRQRRWIINTGIQPEQMIGLDIILDSPACWLAIPPENGSADLDDYSIIPVIVLNSSADLVDELENGLDNVDLEIIEAY